MATAKRSVICLNATYVSALIVVSLFSSCLRSKPFPDWFIGSWNTKFDGIDINETWKKSGDQYDGVATWSSQTKKRKEIMSLYYQGDTLIYSVKIDKKRTKFACLDPYNDTLIFVNWKNNFPKRLVYVKPAGKKMSVWVDNEPGDPNRISYPFKKD